MSKEPQQTTETLSLVCHNFTDIRRHPLVIGRLDKMNLPFVVTMPQVTVGGLVMLLLYLTRGLWGVIVDDRLDIFVFALVPLLIAKGVTRTTFEGRSIIKAAAGMMRLAGAPKHGLVNGRRCKTNEKTRMTLHPILLIPKKRFRQQPPAQQRQQPSAQAQPQPQAKPQGQAQAAPANNAKLSKRQIKKRQKALAKQAKSSSNPANWAPPEPKPASTPPATTDAPLNSPATGDKTTDEKDQTSVVETKT